MDADNSDEDSELVLCRTGCTTAADDARRTNSVDDLGGGGVGGGGGGGAAAAAAAVGADILSSMTENSWKLSAIFAESSLRSIDRQRETGRCGGCCWCCCDGRESTALLRRASVKECLLVGCIFIVSKEQQRLLIIEHALNVLKEERRG